MQYFQHNFERVEEYLHHRRPYLLVENIVSIDSREIVTSKLVGEQDFFLDGHFPGAPIMPGAMMQELTTQSAGILLAARYNPMEQFNTEDPFFNEYAIGVLLKIKQARYKTFARPGDLLTVTVTLVENLDHVFDFTGKVSVGDRQVMKNQFQLANIKSSTLQGTE